MFVVILIYFSDNFFLKLIFLIIGIYRMYSKCENLLFGNPRNNFKQFFFAKTFVTALLTNY